MNDSVAGEPQAPSAASEASAPTGFGAMLAQARARAGLSQEEAAARLRLHPRQLSALEREDLGALPPVAATVSGFVRNYARELKIDAQPLIKDLTAKLAVQGLNRESLDLNSPGASHAPLLDDRGWRHLVLAGIIALLVCAGLIGAWMAHPGAGKVDAAAPNARTTVGEPAHSAGAASEIPTSPPASSAARGAMTPGGAPAAVLPGTTGPGVTARASPPTAGAEATPPRPGAAGLLLRFDERSWIEVSAPDGRVLMSHNGEAGSVEVLNASSPLVLVVGRADAVRVEYRGQPVDLKPYVNSKGVARLMFADGRVSGGGPLTR